LRTLLGLESLDAVALVVTGGAAAGTWALAEIVNRVLLLRGAAQPTEHAKAP